jgi:hypothetical protein
MLTPRLPSFFRVTGAGLAVTSTSLIEKETPGKERLVFPLNFVSKFSGGAGEQRCRLSPI